MSPNAVSSVSSAGGNTNPQRFRCRRWTFTLNNYTDEEVSQITQYFTQYEAKWIIGKEVGEEGTPHLQGYVEFKFQKSFSMLHAFNERIHWEKARGNRKHNLLYCCKENIFFSNFPLPRNERLMLGYADVSWKPWQTQIMELVSPTAEICPRTIYWCWEDTGNTGKSFLAKYLTLKYDAVLACNKKADLFHTIAEWLENHEEDEDPKLIIVDIPRNDQEFINYGAIEQAKNGCFQSGKYKGRACLYNPPHVIVFANRLPDFDKMSKDRWVIIKVDHKQIP